MPPEFFPSKTMSARVFGEILNKSSAEDLARWYQNGLFVLTSMKTSRKRVFVWEGMAGGYISGRYVTDKTELRDVNIPLKEAPVRLAPIVPREFGANGSKGASFFAGRGGGRNNYKTLNLRQFEQIVYPRGNPEDMWTVLFRNRFIEFYGQAPPRDTLLTDVVTKRRNACLLGYKTFLVNEEDKQYIYWGALRVGTFNAQNEAYLDPSFMFLQDEVARDGIRNLKFMKNPFKRPKPKKDPAEALRDLRVNRGPAGLFEFVAMPHENAPVAGERR
jgi:hypothetical protein